MVYVNLFGLFAHLLFTPCMRNDSCKYLWPPSANVQTPEAVLITAVKMTVLRSRRLSV